MPHEDSCRAGEHQTPQRPRFEDVVVVHDPVVPVGDVYDVERHNRRRDKPPSATEFRAGNQEQNRRYGQGDDAKRPLPAGDQAVSNILDSQCRCQVLGPAIVVAKDPRPEPPLTTDDVVESVNMPRRVRIRVELIRGCPTTAGGGMVVAEHNQEPGDHRCANGNAKAQPGLPTAVVGAAVAPNNPPEQPDAEGQADSRRRHGAAQHRVAQTDPGQTAVPPAFCPLTTRHEIQEQRQTNQSRMVRQEQVAKESHPRREGGQ